MKRGRMRNGERTAPNLCGARYHLGYQSIEDRLQSLVVVRMAVDRSVAWPGGVA